MATLSKNGNYPAGVSAPGQTITPAGTPSGVTVNHKSGVAAGQQTDMTQHSAVTLVTNRPLAGEPVSNAIRNEDDSTYRGRGAGYSESGK